LLNAALICRNLWKREAEAQVADESSAVSQVDAETGLAVVLVMSRGACLNPKTDWR